METHAMRMKERKTKKGKSFKKADIVSKKFLSQHSKCESKYISSNRLTRPIGLYNQGKISYLVSRSDELASPRMKARVQQDLHKILNLAKDQDSINKNRRKRKFVEVGQPDGIYPEALNGSENRVQHNSNLPPSAVESPVEMDVDDVPPQRVPYASTVMIPMTTHVENYSSHAIRRPSLSEKPSNNNYVVSSSSESADKRTLDTKVDPEISDFVIHCIDVWALRLLQEDQQETNSTEQAKTPNDPGCSKQRWTTSSSSSSSQTATNVTQHITLSSSDGSPSSWSVDETCDSLALRELSNTQQESDEDIGHSSPLNYRHVLENATPSSEERSSSNDYETAECWSPISDDELTNFIENEENFLQLDGGATIRSPPSPPKISPLKRPCLKVESPKIFFRHKMY